MNLTGKKVFDSGPIYCDGLTRNLWWKNHYGDIYIRKTAVWTGARMGFLGDMVCDFYNQGSAIRRNDSLIGFIWWDHYGDPVAPDHQKVFDLTPDWSYLKNGDYLRLTFDTSRDTRFRQHHKAAIWFY